MKLKGNEETKSIEPKQKKQKNLLVFSLAFIFLFVSKSGTKFVKK